MIIVPITNEMIERSLKRAEEPEAKEKFRIRPTSIKSGIGLLYGYLGEEVALQCIPESVLVYNNPDYDLLYKNKIRIEVKTAKCHSVPLGHYKCAVSEYNPNQQCDYYVFVRVYYVGEKPTTGFYLGSIERKKFYESASWEDKGVEGTNKVNGQPFVASAPYFYVPITKLHQRGEILR